MTGDVVVDHDLAAALDAGLDALSLPLGPAMRDALLGYVALLAKWNRTYNLTAIREPAKMVSHHLLDCLAALPTLDRCVGSGGEVRLLDVGSGAGLPGLPIAIARPGWQVTMLEPVHKKATFIAQAIAELGVRNARATPLRVEDFASEGGHCIVISRAFADLAAFAASSSRHLAPAGALVAMKGVHPDEELREVPTGVAVTDVVPLAVPGVDGARHLVVMQRESP